MRLLRAITITALLVLLLPLAAQATDKGASLKYGGGGLGTVIFDGRMHAGKGYVCKDCHLDLFVTGKKAQVRMSDHFTDKLCFKCHDNKEAPKDCITCHRNVKSTGLTYSPYMRAAMARPVVNEDERNALLSGRSGVSEQTRACLSCHGSPELKAVTERGRSLNLYVPQEAYASGAHGALPCAACHFAQEGESSFARQPHAISSTEKIDCKSCHVERLAKELASFNESVHTKKTEGRFVCISCHNVHSQPQAGKLPAYAASSAEYNKACLSCHANPGRFAKLSANPLDIKAMEHGFMLKFAEHSQSVLCADCHSPLGADGMVASSMGADPHRILEKTQALRACSTCHRDMNSLIISRIAERDGGVDSMQGSYIPALKGIGGLDKGAGLAFMCAFGLIALHALARVFGRKAKHAEELKEEYIYPAPVRLLHWVNAACFVLLIWSGIGIRFEGLSFVPALELATHIHNYSAYLLIINFACFLLYAVASGEIRQYLPKAAGMCGRIMAQARYYLVGIFTGADKPFKVSRKQRFNPLQQITYLFVFILGMPLLILSGCLLLLPESCTATLAAREVLATVHYAIAIAYALFLAAHLYLTTTGDSVFSLIKGMITGKHKSYEDDESKDNLK